MSRVSPHKLDDALLNDLLAELAKVLSRVKGRENMVLLTTLFTSEEKIMFSKRIAVLSMLYEGVSMYRISQVLKMSLSTVIRMKRNYKKGQYDPLIRALEKNKKDREKFWKTLELILGAGLPPRGKGRWKLFYKYAGS